MHVSVCVPVCVTVPWCGDVFPCPFTTHSNHLNMPAITYHTYLPYHTYNSLLEIQRTESTISSGVCARFFRQNFAIPRRATISKNSKRVTEKEGEEEGKGEGEETEREIHTMWLYGFIYTTHTAPYGGIKLNKKT